MKRPTVAILAAPGTNRHLDMQFAFELVGAEVEHIDVTELPEHVRLLESAKIIAVAGGFSYADALGSGRVFAEELTHRVGDLLRERVAAGVPIIGVCNGFQTLVRTGLLPGNPARRATLAHNENGSFECRWVSLVVPPSSRCIWTRGLAPIVTMPVAHGEGRFLVDDATHAELVDRGQVAFRYADAHGAPAAGAYPTNPNGSRDDIAGISDATGLVLGMMPHPENHVTERQSRAGSTIGSAGSALPLFANGVEHVR